MDIQTRNLKEGIHLYLLPDNKFKNCVFSISFGMPLKKETATGLALLPKVLTAGNSKYSDRSALNMELENLYGARLSAISEKVGETQVISFAGDVIADRYADEALFSQLLALLETVILKPQTEGVGFKATAFEREKEALREDIRSIVNDKRRYALVRCAEEMCKDEPYGISAEGEEEQLSACTPENTFALYREMLENASVDIFVVGAFKEEEAAQCAQSLAEKLGDRTVKKQSIDHSLPSEVCYVEDREPVQQGKLVIGYRTDVDPASEDWYKLLVYNAIFGGGTSSKLFNNVREKMSLCYYASSGLERAKGLMFVQSGIEFDKYEVALSAIREQSEAILKGDISEAEFRGAVQGIINQLRSHKDSPSRLVGYLRRQIMAGGTPDIDAVIEKINAVTPEAIPQIAAKVYMDTVYFLNGAEGGTK